MLTKKSFLQYVIPSIGACLVTALYVVVDGIFVGRGVGANAIAAVNIAWPFVAILTAVTMMLTMGGATLCSIYFGEKKYKEAGNTFSVTLFSVLCFALFMMILALLFADEIVVLLGASETLAEYASTYLTFYVLFGAFFCLSVVLSIFVKNDHDPILAFWGMIAGALSNVFLDWLFIFPLQMGIKGAAIASGLGQVVACIILFFHFFKKRGILRIRMPHFKISLLIQIIKVGLPEFITQMSQPITILCYNLVIAHYFGDIGVSAFAIVSYIVVITLSLFTGVSQGIQPLISYSVGQKNKENEQYFLRRGLFLSIICAVGIYIVMLFAGRYIIMIFTGENDIINLAHQCMTIYGVSFIFASINIVYTSYTLAAKKTRYSLIIAGLRSFICNSTFIILTPLLFGVAGIWHGVIISEFIVFLAVLIFFFISLKKSIQTKTS